MDTVFYVHGKNGSAEEAAHYRPLFPACSVTGIDYQGPTPWEAGKEIREAVFKQSENGGRVILIANSIGAFFSMHADIEDRIDHAFFVSPVVDMEKLITGMMALAGVSEPELRERGIIPTSFGEDLSWEYLCYVREHPVRWTVPTDILYGSRDSLISAESVSSFVRCHRASLTVLEGGEHWFHTEEQRRFLDRWILERKQNGIV